MSWLGWFGLAIIVTGFAAITGLKAKGTRPVEHTSLMGVARLVLLVLVLVCVYFAYRTYSGG